MHWRRKWQPTPVFLPGESLCFRLCWVFTAARRLSLVVVSRGYSSLQRLPSWGAQALGPWASAVGAHRPSSCGSWAPEHRLGSCGPWAPLLHGTWNLPGPGIQPVSPAPPGKSQLPCLTVKRALKEDLYVVAPTPTLGLLLRGPSLLILPSADPLLWKPPQDVTALSACHVPGAGRLYSLPVSHLVLIPCLIGSSLLPRYNLLFWPSC